MKLADMKLAELVKEKRQQIAMTHEDLRKWMGLRAIRERVSVSISNSFAGQLMEKLALLSLFEEEVAATENATAIYDSLKADLGKQIHLSDWCCVTQESINDFANVTGDDQWIHVDIEKARAESPYRSTVAHGFLLLSLLPKLRELNHYAKARYPNARMLLNCGLAEVEFLRPVKPGQFIRSRTWLRSLKLNKRSIDLVEEVCIEIEGQASNACSLKLLLRLYL